MRIFEPDKRLNHSMNTIQYFFDNEFQYYKENNKYPFRVDGISHISLYRRLNVQLLVTKRCPFQCHFCVERINPVGDYNEDEDKQLKSLEKVLIALQHAGLEPTVSITGGEPMLKQEVIMKTTELLDRLNVMYNLNTSGYGKDQKNVLDRMKRINLSVHNADPVINASVFKRKEERYWDEPVYEKATVQAVLYEEPTLGSIREFINSFPQKRFSLRFPTEDIDVPTVEWKQLFDELEKEREIGNVAFVQQKIGDYYFYEQWMIGDKLVHFSFSSLTQLRRNQERENGFVRAVIIQPDGEIIYDWI